MDIGGEEIRRIRMASYISLISMLTMLSYILVYLIIDVDLFKPAIYWLLIGVVCCLCTMGLNKKGKHKLAKIMLALINPVFMTGAATIMFGQELQFQTFLLISVYVPLFLWSLKKDVPELVIFISLSIAIYVYVEFFMLPINALVVLPYELVVGFQKSNVLVCFAAAGLAIAVFMILAYRKEDKLVIKTIELEQAQKHRDTIYSIIAHDLRSPFNGLVGISDLLLRNFDGFSDHDKKEYLSSINQSSVSLNTLLENLLEWSKMQSGKMQASYEVINVNEVIMSILELFKSILNSKQITLKCMVSENIVVKADKFMFSTVIRNLINNAIKFTNTNGYIQIDAKHKNGHVEVCIADNGVGIPANEIPTIFNPESEFIKRGTHEEKGSGLGLKLCSDFISAMKGSIRVESELNKGSRFYITLDSA